MAIREDQHQMTLIRWKQQPSIMAQWPELALLYHVPNERICDPRYGKKLRLMGVRRGVPDLCLPVARGRYHGLYIEMKSEDGDTTSDQEWWGEKLQAQGYAWKVCHGYEPAIEVLKWYMSLPAGGPHEQTG